MRFLESIPLASVLAVACLSAQEPILEFGSESKARLEEELARFQGAHSIGFLDQAYIEVHDTSGIQFGFGYLRKPPTGKGGAPKPSHRHEIVLGGRVLRPDQTVKAVVNGIPGLPDSIGWMFRLDSGRITSYGREPEGQPERVRILETTHALGTRAGMAAFRGYLKRIPEAFAKLGPEQAAFDGTAVLMRGRIAANADYTGAIRYFNAAPDREMVADTAYLAGLETEFALGGRAFAGSLAEKIGARLALNPNDLPALGFKAQALCNEGKAAEAEQVLQAAAAIRADHYRLPLARAACLEKAVRLRDANAQLDSALRVADPGDFAGILDRIEDNSRTARFDSSYAERGRRSFWMEWDVAGFGIAQAVIGTSASVHWNMGDFAASVSIGAGLAYVLKPPAGPPALNFRAYSPGRKARFYLGFGAINPFNLGSGHHYALFGPEAGLSHDIGEPAGFKLNYGLSFVRFMKFNPPEDFDQTDDSFVLPHGSIVYAF